MMRTKVVTAPTVEPVTVAEVKAQCRIDSSSEDALLAIYIQAAREYAETFTRRAFCTQTLRGWLDVWPPDDKPWIYLPNPPLASVSSITYVDSAGVTQTWSSSNYVVDGNTTTTARIGLAYGASFPTLRSGLQNAITVNWSAGYGAAAAVPAAIKQALLLIVAHWFENRESVVIGSIATNVPMAANSLLSSVRVYEAPGYDIT